jgi:hypothetical protein
MKKEIKNGVLKGYEIGNSILIHSHLKDPESWFLTIRSLEIFGLRLCKKDCREQDIARYVNVLLNKKLKVVNELVEDLSKYT